MILTEYRYATTTCQPGGLLDAECSEAASELVLHRWPLTRSLGEKPPSCPRRGFACLLSQEFPWQVQILLTDKNGTFHDNNDH